jgi:hypothetical protein
MKMPRILFMGLIFAAWIAPAFCQEGSWDTLKKDEREERPRLKWELLKGFRLFFHPEDLQAMRRSMLLAMPRGYQLRTAYLLIRPRPDKGSIPKAWLRVEGSSFQGQVRFDWDGCYQHQEFPDGLYEVDLNLYYQGGISQRVNLVVLKSKDHPRFVKVGNREFRKQRFHFVDGEFVPEEANLALSKSATPQAPLVGEVFLPFLEGEFTASGAMLSYREVIQEEGKPEEYGAWDCFCQQVIPANSEARQKLKKVACAWDLTDVEPGLYDLKISIWHEPKRVKNPDACDVPILDYESVRVQVTP